MAPAWHGEGVLVGSRGSAVVLGGGGVAGAAWMVGLAAGLRRRGVDLAQADLIIGTSAGSLAGTLIGSGADLDDLADGPRSPAPSRSYEFDPRLLAQMSSQPPDASPGPAQARRRMAEAAASTATEGAEDHLSWMRWIVGTPEWPERPLWVTAVDIDTGERVTWDRSSGVPLLTAVASSCAISMFTPPVVINGRRYVDGGAASPTNADLAVGVQRLVVIDPIAHVYPRDSLQREIATVMADTVVTIGPNAAVQAAYGSNILDNAAWPLVYRTGIGQAGEVAEQLRAALV
jgi:NTE family protein